MNTELTALQSLNFWSTVDRPRGKPLHTKFVFKRLRDKKRDISRHQARLVLCGIEEEEFMEDSFYTVVDFTVAKLILYLSLQQKWQGRHLDFENAFPNKKLDRLEYTELPKFF